MNKKCHVLKIKGLLRFSASLSCRCAVIRLWKYISDKPLSHHMSWLFISEDLCASASRKPCQGPSLFLCGSTRLESPLGAKCLLMGCVRLSWQKSCCCSKTASCTYPPNQQEINGMLFILTLRSVTHRARARVSLQIKDWLWDRRERFVMNCCFSACKRD